MAPLVAFVAKHARALREQAAVTARVASPSQIHDTHPGCATLFRYRRHERWGLELLICLGLCALLEASKPDRSRVMRMLSMVRGALDSPDSDIALVLGATTTIPDLIRIVAAESTANALPSEFLRIWNSWLRDTLARWMLARPDRLRQALEPSVLVPSLDAPEVLVSIDEGDPEGATPLTCFSSQESEADSDLPASIKVGRAASAHLERVSQGDLLSPPEFRFPRGLDERLCQEAVRRAKALLRQDPFQAEPIVALLLSLGGGIREIDLGRIVWGGEACALPLSIDPVLPVLYRQIKRPPNAVKPSEDLSAWIEPTLDVIAWPLAPSIHEAVVGLHLPAEPHVGDPVLPRQAASLCLPYQLREVMRMLLPEASVGALLPRLAFAAELAKELGSEMTQLAMADTFSMSLVPAYYSAITEAELAETIARIQARRFGETVEPTIKRASYIGSRLVVTDVASKRWAGRLNNALRNAARLPEDSIGVWRAHRDHLAATLVCATGHRPEGALGRIRLSDVIPEYGLIVLQDKQVDALRATRIAATGRLWLSDLRRYLNRLIQLSNDLAGSPAGELADAIVRGQAPLFNLPGADGAVSPMTAAVLRAGMPPELSALDNYYRHRLNQMLQRQRVDPELRHAQLGWVASAAHANADLSPWAPTNLGQVLGPVIDDLLVSDGWYLKSARKTRWTWEGIPMPAAVDWHAVFSAHLRQHQNKIKEVRLKLHERRREVEPSVLTRMAAAVQEIYPTLRLDLDKRRLVPVAAGRGTKVEMGFDHYALICDRVRLDDADPSSALEAVTARIWLYRLVRRALAAGLVRGPIPNRVFLSDTSDPSPFVLGLGTAIRHAESLRQALVTRAQQGGPQDLRYLTVLSILAYSACRRMKWALAATSAARTCLRSSRRDHFIRISAVVDGVETPMVFSGVAATLLSRRKRDAPTARAPKIAELEGWVLKHLGGAIRWGEPGVVMGELEGALMAAGQVELSGVERVLLWARERSASESSLRCLARDDDWPARTAELSSPEADVGGNRRQRANTEPASTGHQFRTHREAYLRYVGLLNKQSFARLRASRNTSQGRPASDGKHRWRRFLAQELRKLADGSDRNPNLRLLIEYSLDHLRYGSEAGNTLSHRSLHREMVQIGWPLLVNVADRELAALTGEALHQVYRQVLLSKSPAARRYVFEELQRFQRYVARAHAVPVIEMTELASLAGARMAAVDPGLVTPHELEVTYQALVADIQGEHQRSDASPDFLRLATLRLAMFLILEAAGIRPGSAYGLTLADVHFLDSGDFVRVTDTGDYGEAKTATSVGFVLLEGSLWCRHRAWLVGFIEEQRASQKRELWQKRPLFADGPGQRKRFAQEHLTRRIDELLKWATGKANAHSYWLRKTRVSERFRAVQAMPTPSPRDVYAIMMLSGHATIQTPIESYINDPANLLFADLRNAARTPRAEVLAFSGLAAGPLDMAWSRSGNEVSRMSIVLDGLGVDAEAVPPALRTDVPPLRRFRAFAPLHVDGYAHTMHRSGSRSEAILKAGITDTQADRLDSLAYVMLQRRGCTPWPIAYSAGMRSTMELPRRLKGTEKAFDVLKHVPTPGMIELANLWMDQARVERIHGRQIILELSNGEAVTAAESLLSGSGLKMQVVAVGGRHLLREQPPPGQVKGHGAALRWVLAIVWLFSHMSAETSADTPRVAVER